jgi:hypothetical protein
MPPIHYLANRVEGVPAETALPAFSDLTGLGEIPKRLGFQLSRRPSRPAAAFADTPRRLRRQA